MSARSLITAALILAFGAVLPLAPARAGADLDEAAPYILEPWQAPIEAEVVAFDVAGPDRKPLCLAVAGKSVFLLQPSRRIWKTIDVVMPAGRAVSGGFIEAPDKERLGAKDAVRFFVSSVHPDGRVQSTFYVSVKGKTRMESQTAGRFYRRDGPVLFSQKAAGDGPRPVVVEMGVPGALPRSIGKLALPDGTGLFEFARLGEVEDEELVRIESDEAVVLWSKMQPAFRLDLAVGRPPLDLPEGVAKATGSWRVPPLVTDVDGMKGDEIVIAVNDPDLEGGGFFKAGEHRSRIAVLAAAREGGQEILKVIGGTPTVEGSIPAMALVAGRVVVAVVDAGKRRTALYRLMPATGRLSKEARRARFE